MLYNCSPSFNWKKHLDDSTIQSLGTRYNGLQISIYYSSWVASLHSGMFNLAHGIRNQMSAYVELQEARIAAAEKGFAAVKHQRLA